MFGKPTILGSLMAAKYFRDKEPTMAWNTDAQHTSFEFAVRHMVVSTVRGRFDEFAVEADIDESDLTRSKGKVVVRTGSVSTREAQRDAHLSSPDFFDAESYPEMTYVVTGIAGADGQYTITGDLTIKDVTREVVLDAEVSGPVADPWGSSRIGLSATGKLNRKDFGLTWNVVTEAGGLLVGDDVKLSIDAEFVKAREAVEAEAATTGATA
jgi:polyisoprenoid-binding protein YceI